MAIFSFGCINEEAPIMETQIEIDTICTDTSFNIKDFVLELHLQKIKYTDIVLRQACLETGFFTSYVWRTKNNPFGFYYDGDYILFNDWRDAVTYYKEWQDRKYKGGNYYEFLENVGYAEDTTYTERVKNINLKNLETN